MKISLMDPPNNPRAHWQSAVEKLCKTLAKSENASYRGLVFRLIQQWEGKQYKRLGAAEYLSSRPARIFIKMFPVDIRAREILNQIATIYDNRSENETNDLRGAVGEVYAFIMCKRVYPKYHGIEVCPVINSYTCADPIDAVGYCLADNYCLDKGHCLQSKIGSFNKESTLRQKNTFDEIERLTNNKIACLFFTFLDDSAIKQRFRLNRIDPKGYNFFSLQDMLLLEQRIKEHSPGN